MLQAANHVFFTHLDDVIIAGMLNQDWVWWLSVTNISNEDEIRQIFYYISNQVHSEGIRINSVIHRTNYSEEQLKHCLYTFPQTADDIFEYYHRIKISISETEKGGKYYGIQNYNYLTPEYAASPKYVPSPRDCFINVYYADDNNIIIVGVADNNFIYWLSVTKINNKVNLAILDWLNICVPTLFESMGFAIKRTKYTYKQVMSFHCAKVNEINDIIQQKKLALKKSQTENDDGNILQKLQSYRKRFSKCSGNPRRDYARHKVMIQEIKAKSYLRGSDDPKVRELYNEVDRLCSKIYNDYMTEIH